MCWACDEDATAFRLCVAQRLQFAVDSGQASLQEFLLAKHIGNVQ